MSEELKQRNVIDGNPYFKKANLLSLPNEELELVYAALHFGAVKETTRYLFKPQDMPIVNKAIDKRVKDLLKGGPSRPQIR